MFTNFACGSGIVIRANDQHQSANPGVTAACKCGAEGRRSKRMTATVFFRFFSVTLFFALREGDSADFRCVSKITGPNFPIRLTHACTEPRPCSPHTIFERKRFLLEGLEVLNRLQ